MSSLTIRKMSEEEIKIAVDWAAEEGWNPGLNDAACFYRTDPDGFYLGEIDGKPVGCISVVSYLGVFGFLGFYIVHPDYRARGYGIQIWNEAIKYLRNHNIGLDGVVTQQDNYKKSGFKLAYRNIRYEGSSVDSVKDSESIISADKIAFDKLLKYDSNFFPVQREKFLKCWVNMPDSYSFVFNDNGIKGMGTIRKCRRGWKIGPLFSDNAEIAELLFNSLCSKIENNSAVFLDVPEVNPDAVALAEKYKMIKVFETARMYTKAEPKMKLNGIFGVTTFELG